MNEAQRKAIETEIVALTPALKCFARRFHRSEDDADDLVQETLLKALASIHLYAPGTALRSWLFTIMRNSFCTKYRKMLREPVGPDRDFQDVSTPPTQEWSIRQNELRSALGRMPAPRRRALVLVTLGTSYKEIAQLCGCRIGTVKSRVNRARRDLLTELGSR
ncbi:MULTISPECIES: sigma-70 family RNA polymerase sigma factor [unclassified Sinorhizobium]|uniref:sigma-70 family RNA polymerase sigma factor n=1 Tax=unclassified Sinorhizobium TaxID=2613772 RepID=UPI0035248101